jgi:hypothetical protein
MSIDHFVGVRRSRDRTRNVERPNDLEALKHGQDLVVFLEPFTVRLPGEIAAMSMEPPLGSSVPLSSEANAPSTCDSGFIVTSVFAR